MDKSIVNPLVPYAYENMMREALLLRERYPELIQLGSIGKSSEGRELTVLRLGDGERHVLLVGAHHGREYISSALLMRMCEEYAGRAGLRSLWRRVSLWFVPMLNPDGVEISIYGKSALTEKNKDFVCILGDYATWKANARGVDLNRNYPCLFEKKRSTVLVPASEMYKGEKPASECEVQALMAFTRQIPFCLAATFHAKGEEIFYGDSNTPETTDISFEIAKTLQSECGYALAPISQDPGIFAAGFENWFRQEYKRPCLLLELAPFDGYIPHNMKNFDRLVWQKMRETGKILAEWVDNK